MPKVKKKKAKKKVKKALQPLRLEEVVRSIDKARADLQQIHGGLMELSNYLLTYGVDKMTAEPEDDIPF